MPSIQGFFVPPNRRRIISYEEVVDSYDDRGGIYARFNYHYFDIGGRFKIINANSNSISLYQGVTFTYGIDQYITNVIAIELPHEPFHIITVDIEESKAFYFGGITGLRYNYQFWKNRLNIGADFVARYYNKSFPFQWNYGLHLGYNF